jgi:hypothetical protein
MSTKSDQLKATQVSLRDQLKAMQVSFREIDKQLQEIFRQQNRLAETEERIKRSIIINEKLLVDDEWELQIRGDEVTLFGGRRGKGFDRLRDLIETDYHCHFDLTPKIQIFFSDGELYMSFEKDVKIITFIQSMGMKVNVEAVKEERDRLRRTMQNIDQIMFDQVTATFPD